MDQNLLTRPASRSCRCESGRTAARILALVLAPVVVSPALAQDVSGEAAVGYNYLHDGRYDRDYREGFFLGLGIWPTSRLAFVVEAAANSTHDSGFALRLWSLQMGPRVRLFPGRGPVAVQAQFLVGVSRDGERMTDPVLLDWSYQDHLILQPALGLDFAVTRHLALRAGAGMSFIAFKSTPCARCETYTDWGRLARVHVGIVVRFGRGN